MGNFRNLNHCWESLLEVMEFSKGVLNGCLLDGPIFLFDNTDNGNLKLSGPSVSLIVPQN